MFSITYNLKCYSWECSMVAGCVLACASLGVQRPAPREQNKKRSDTVHQINKKLQHSVRIWKAAFLICICVCVSLSVCVCPSVCLYTCVYICLCLLHELQGDVLLCGIHFSLSILWILEFKLRLSGLKSSTFACWDKLLSPTILFR